MGHNEDVVCTWEGVCDIPHWIWEKVLDTIDVETLFNQVYVF